MRGWQFGAPLLASSLVLFWCRPIAIGALAIASCALWKIPSPSQPPNHFR